MIKKLILSVAVCCAAISARAQIQFFEGTWDAALARAAKTNKLIFMDCYTSWCGPCKALAKETFTDKTVGDFFNANFINTHYDMEKGEGKMLQGRYAAYVKNYPTLLLIDKDGKVVHQMVGYKRPDALLAAVKEGMGTNSLSALEQRYTAGGRNHELIAAYTAALEGAFQHSKAQTVADDYLQALPLDSIGSRRVWTDLGKYINNPYSAQFDYMTTRLGKQFVESVGGNAQSASRQWNNAVWREMERLVNLPQDTAGNYVETLVNEPEKSRKLADVAQRSSLPCDSEVVAKLQIHQQELDGQWDVVYTLTMSIQNTAAAGVPTVFSNQTFWLLARHLSDKKKLKACLARAEAIQTEAAQRKSFLQPNNYNVQAALHNALGNKAEADACEAKFTQIRAENVAKVRRVAEEAKSEK